jgi:hypothetical protein
MEHIRDSEDEYYLFWLKYSGQMERRLKALQSTLAWKERRSSNIALCFAMTGVRATIELFCS